MKIIIKVILVIVIVILCIYCGVARLEQKENEIKKWASDHNYVIVSKEMNYTIFGSPFYYLGKGEHIYKLTMDNGDIWWVRTCYFSNDYEKEKVLRN